MSERYPGGIISKTPVTPSGPYANSTAPGVWTLDQQLQFQQAGNWPTAGSFPNYIEDVFSTYLYTGTGATQTITNNIDLSTKGGLTWIKWRANGGTQYHALFDTARGATKFLSSNVTDASTTASTSLTSFNTNGFSLGADSSYNYVNGSPLTYASWTFRKQAKFFDVVTYTGTGSATTIAHNLGSVPGCIIVKRTDTTGAWQVYHGSLANTQYMVLNTTAAVATGTTRWNSTTPTSAVFSVGTDATVNASGGTYVAYLFASNAGGFGNAGTDNVITCGSFTTDGSGNATVTLGYEPQWVMIKSSTSVQNWYMVDNMRGFDLTGRAILFPNLSNAEAATGNAYLSPNSTGFSAVNGNLDASTTYIYIAIRRGPMQTPTTGTSVYGGFNTTAGATYSVGFVPDLAISPQLLGAGDNALAGTRLTGNTKYLVTSSTAAEVTNGGEWVWNGTTNTFVDQGTTFDWLFKRAPGFCDVVCWTGTGVAAGITHNLGVVPEMIIYKDRINVDYWRVGTNFTATTWKPTFLNSDIASNGDGSNLTYDSTHQYTAQPTTTQFFLGSYYNVSATTYVAYLFATIAGVSKVGSYTGNGTTQTIDCGFGAGGVRFVLIKRTDSTGGWYVYDTTRGMTTLVDPYILLNSTAAQVATLGSVTTVSTGFALNSSILAAINVNAGTYIFLAIA